MKNFFNFTVPLIFLIITVVFVRHCADLKKQTEKLRKQRAELQRCAKKPQFQTSWLNELVENSASMTSPQYVLKVKTVDGTNFLLVTGVASFISMADCPGKHGNWNITVLYWAMKMDESAEDGLSVVLPEEKLDRFSSELIAWSDYETFAKGNNKLLLREFLGRYFVDKGRYWQMKEALMGHANDSIRYDLMVIGYLSRHFHLVVYQADYSGQYFVKKRTDN